MPRLATMLLVSMLVGGCASSPSVAPQAMEGGRPPDESAVPLCRPEEWKNLQPSASGTPTSVVCRTEDLNDAARLAQALPRESTLVVLDIDDTVLTAPPGHFFGSDRWYRWQKNLPKSDPEKIQCLTTDLLGFDYESARLASTQKDAASIVNAIANDKLFLTSRSPDYRGGTQRELKNIQVAYPAALPGQEPRFFLIGDRPASYNNGIFMTSGANKGVALLELLKTKNQNTVDYRTVILVDDGGENIAFMQKALAEHNPPIGYYGLQYERIKVDPYPKLMSEPSSPEIVQSRAAMTRWLTFMRDQYPERYEALQQSCGDFKADPKP